MSNWRPEGWKNPWRRHLNEDWLHREFELGADAMHKAIVEWGDEMCREHQALRGVSKRKCQMCWQAFREEQP